MKFIFFANNFLKTDIHYFVNYLNNDGKMMTLNGDVDLVSPWNGAEAWNEAIGWKYQNEYIQ